MNTTQYLLEKYGDINLDMKQLAEVLKYSSAKTLLNAVSAETCPIHTFKLGRRRFARVEDAARYLDTAAGTIDAQPIAAA